MDSKDGATGRPSLSVTYTTASLAETNNVKKIEIYPIPAEE